MEDDGQPTDNGSSGDAHASVLATLAESSATRTMKSEEATSQAGETPRDTEQVHVKLEKARARMGASLAEIPTGREYDSPPDTADEPVYDALEKAYNAAFLVHSPAAEYVHKVDPMVRHEKKLSALDSGEAAGSGLKDDRKDGNEDERATQVGTLKSMYLSSVKQQAATNGQSEAKDAQMKSDANAIPPVSLTGRGSEGADSGGDVVERSTTPASGSADSLVSTASLLQSPKSVTKRTSTDDVSQSTPEAKRERHDVIMKPKAVEKDRVERADHLSLNEFLVAELEVYCSQLLEKGFPKRGSSGAGDLARITGLQLFQDHRRALMDFEDEWKRSHADSYRGYKPTTTEDLPRVSSIISANPFQQGSANPIGVDEWATLLNQVTASSTKSTPTGTSDSPELIVRGSSEDLFASFKRGSNGVIVGGDSCNKERLQISAFMAQIASSQSTSAFYVVLAAGSDLARWEKALSSEQRIQLYPYWGSQQDRQNLLQLLSNQYFSSRNLSAHVLLTSYEVFMEDISVVTSLQCQLSIIDIPRQATDEIAAIWPQILSLRCRQRLLLCQPSFEVDVRKLLHFLVPELFSSRRKLLAWNSAGFHTHQIRAVCNVMGAFMLDSNEEACTAFMANVESCTKQNSEIEMTALDTLNKQGIVRALEPSIMVPVKRVLNRKPCSRPSGHIPAQGKLEPQHTAMAPVDSQLTIKAPNVLLKKRKGSDGMSGSRQRIGRCGKCAGCLAEDCMKCGHCQDMKKYGGPGLRKQSCKYRKCLNPKIWGYATRKRKRSKMKRAGSNSVKGDSERDDDGSVAYSSGESDRESVSTATYGNGDSDDESLQYSDATMDSPHDLLLPASDTLLDDHLSLSDLSSGSAPAKSRVVRCGECEGCNAPDCMKCPHCLDMKKYGGPGLRKQTCKNRKCNGPKLLMLNKAKGGYDQYVDEKGNVVYSGLNDGTFPEFYEAPDLSERPESTPPSAHSHSGGLTVIQECERYVQSRLVFACVDCAARFSSSKVLNFHTRVEHSPSISQRARAATALEREASHFFTHPIYRNAMISAHLKLYDRCSQNSPLGYAKLEGQDFQFFFIEPLVVLGRMESRWCNLYKDMGFGNLKGLPGGNVDCHVGNDSMIVTRHAVISWDARTKSFVIECLSLRTPISVNGREISFSSPPTALRSRNVVQIGASVFYFLLPKATKTSSTCSAIEESSTSHV